MRVLLDECVPVSLGRELTGHEVTSTRRQGWASLADKDLLHQAAYEFDVFLTVDQSLEHQQAVPSRLAVITIVTRSIHVEALRSHVPAILAAMRSIQPGDSVRIGENDNR